MADYVEIQSRPKWTRYGTWVAQGLIALTFVAAGSGKILGSADMVALFDDIGAGQWFRYVTGGLEYIAAFLLVIPATAFAGGLLAACIMAGAVFTHVALIGGSAVPALVLLALACFVIWARRPGAQ